MDFTAPGKLYAVKAVEAREESVRVGFDVIVVLPEDTQEEEMLGVVDGFNDEAVVTGKVEEGT